MAKRRAMHGKPLLVATVGAAMAVLGSCSGASKSDTMIVSGNLVAPPMVSSEVCVDVTPETAAAAVTVNGQAATERCTTVQTYGSVHVEASASGYVTAATDVEATEKVEVKLELSVEPVPLPKPLDMPVGNLMPPQPPPMPLPEKSATDE